MKNRVLVVLALVTSAFEVVAQGTVNFANAVAFVTPADRRVYNSNGQPIVGSDIASPPTFVAQLYYGTNAASLRAHTAAPARFRPPGPGNEGYWLGGWRILTGFSGGQTVTLQVRVWDMRFGSTFEEAAANPAADNQYGQSQAFPQVIEIPGGCTHPWCGFIDNFRSFRLVTNPPSGDQPPTVLITSPTNNSVFATGASFNLSVVATDDGTITNLSLYSTNGFYRTNSHAMTLSGSISAPGSYSYYAEAIDNKGQTGRSATVVIHVLRPPWIGGWPGNRLVLVGSTTTLSVGGVEGTPPLSYQWFFEGAPLAQATNRTLVLDNLTLEMAGSYFVRVTNLVGAADSAPGTVRVRLLVVLANGVLVQTSPFIGVSPIAVSFSTSFTNADIFFTLDGSPPSRDSTPYTGPFSVSTNVTVRAVAYSEDFSQTSEAEPVELIPFIPAPGMVDFANSRVFGTPADRLVYDSNGQPIVGSDIASPPTFVAQLYYGTNAASLRPHTAAPARFRPPGAGNAGLWLGGVRTLTGFGVGQTVTLQVRVWDMRFGSTFDEAAANRAAGNQYGASSPFFYFLCSGHHCPPPIEGFRAFTLTNSTPLAQSVVDFRNSAPFTTFADRLVYDSNGQPIIGSDLASPATFVAQLYYGTNVSSLQPHSAAPARFRPPGAGNAGLWIGGTRTLTGFSGGQTVILQVRVWDARVGSTFDQAAVNPGSGNQYSISSPFTYLIPAAGSTEPGTEFIENFRAFSLVTNPPPGVVRIRREIDGRLQLVFLGRHNVDISEDLLNWTPLGDQTSPFIDTVLTNLPARFYRLNDSGGGAKVIGDNL